MREELDELKRTIYVLKLETGINAKALLWHFYGCSYCHQKIAAIT
jgi:hypothetical protein